MFHGRVSFWGVYCWDEFHRSTSVVKRMGEFLKHSVLGRNLRRSWTVNEDDLLSKTYFDLNKAWSDVMIFFCDFVHVITGLVFVTKESYINSWWKNDRMMKLHVKLAVELLNSPRKHATTTAYYQYTCMPLFLKTQTTCTWAACCNQYSMAKCVTFGSKEWVDPGVAL